MFIGAFGGEFAGEGADGLGGLHICETGGLVTFLHGGGVGVGGGGRGGVRGGFCMDVAGRGLVDGGAAAIGGGFVVIFAVVTGGGFGGRDEIVDAVFLEQAVGQLLDFGLHLGLAHGDEGEGAAGGAMRAVRPTRWT